MRTFKGNRNLAEIRLIAEDKCFEVDTEAYDKGNDWFALRDMDNRVIQILVNGYNGHFKVYRPFSVEPVATHLSEEFDNEAWYQEILEILYV